MVRTVVSVSAHQRKQPRKSSKSMRGAGKTVHLAARGLPGTGAGRKIYRYEPGTRALSEIKRYQRSYQLLLPKAPFSRLVKEITRHLLARPEIRFESSAIGALQEAAEAFIVHLFMQSHLCTIHAKRVTLMQKDMQLYIKLTQPFGAEIVKAMTAVREICNGSENQTSTSS